MKQGHVLSVALALVASVVLEPATALAGRSHGGGHRGGHARSSGHHGHGGHKHHGGPKHHGFHHGGHKHGFHHGFRGKRFHHKGFVGVIAAPAYVYSPPIYYAEPSYVPPAYYSQSPYSQSSVYVPPQTGVVPRVVEYPTGRYELRGDGVTIPWLWVWIPNPPPPPPPPAAAPETPPPAEEPAPSAPTAPTPSGHRPVYRWTDAQGVVHVTNRADGVPEERLGKPTPASRF